MSKFSDRRITDPVHGTVGLSKVEVEIISTPVFQRLRNIKQLGMAYLVFPGADYSRFSHSIKEYRFRALRQETYLGT